MAIRFRKSYKLAPGVKLNLGKKSAGVSVGGKYFRQSFNTSGRKTTSSSIPGTGISFINTSAKKKKATASKGKKVTKKKNVVPQQDVVVQEETATWDERVVNSNEQPPRKPRIWLWVIMGVVLLSVLGSLLSNNDPEIAVSNSDDGTTQIAETSTTTQFSYLPEEVSLQDEGGTLLAYAKGQQVPYTGILGFMGAQYLVTDGKVEPSYNGVYEDNGTLWLVKEGKLATTENGIVSAGNGDWYAVQDGKVATAVNGVQKNDYGRWYVKDGKVDFSYNGDIMSDGSTYIIKDGKVDTSQNGVMKVGDKWAYVSDGMIAQNYTGVQSNEYGTWYIKKGLVDFDYAGTVTAPDGNRYNVSKGHAERVTTTTKAATTQSSGSDASSNFNTYDNDDDYSSSYVGNSSSMKFHYASCNDVRKMNDGNKVKGHPRSWYISNGYSPCGHCHP